MRDYVSDCHRGTALQPSSGLLLNKVVVLVHAHMHIKRRNWNTKAAAKRTTITSHMMMAGG